MNGSMEVSCDRESGQCACKSNVHGLRCDECDEMFYGLTAAGCEGEFELVHIFHLFAADRSQKSFNLN